MTTTKNTNSLKNIILTFVVIVWTVSCSNSNNEEDNDSTGFCNELTTKATEYQSAVSSFQGNPSEETCNNLRNSALDLIDAAQDCQQFGEQYQGLEEAAEGYRNLDCSQF